jgi:hypothetical protein
MQVDGHAGAGRSALHQSVNQVWADVAGAGWNWNRLVADEQTAVLIKMQLETRVGGHVLGGIPVPGLLVILVVVAEQADAEAHVHREVRADLPVILHIRLIDFVAVVIFELPAVLLVRTDGAGEQIGVFVAGEKIGIAEVAEAQ